MKKLMSIFAASAFLLAACNGETSDKPLVGTPSTVSPVAFSNKEIAIITAMEQTDQNFIAYEVGAGEKMFVKAYIYQDGEVSEYEVYPDKRSGIINAGLMPQGEYLAFKLDGFTTHYSESAYNSFSSDVTDEEIVVTTKPKLVATYHANFKEGEMLSIEGHHETGEVYKKMDPKIASKDDLIIDIVAYVDKK